MSASALTTGLASAVDTMYSGQTLRVDEEIESANQCFRLILQRDGNLVIYRNRDNHPTWATNTMHSGTVRAIMQHDGNFVLYNHHSQATWASGTSWSPSAWLILQNDGNLVIYKEGTWHPIWASNTVTDC